jgi:ABC-2 type transport system ATP-binding protein
MKQRLGLAPRCCGPRELFVLDEPTNGLDPQGTREVRTLVRELAAEGCTVLVSSHLLAEIEQMCDRVTVMRAGRVVAAGTLQELALLARPSVVVETPDLEPAVAVLRRLGASSAAPDADGLRVRAELPDVPVEDVTRALVRADVAVRGIGRSGRSLEELFVDLTGEGFDVVG